MELPKGNKRYTPKHSLVALRQSWMTHDITDPHLTPIGRKLCKAARQSQEAFNQACRELRPEL